MVVDCKHETACVHNDKYASDNEQRRGHRRSWNAIVLVLVVLALSPLAPGYSAIGPVALSVKIAPAIPSGYKVQIVRLFIGINHLLMSPQSHNDGHCQWVHGLLGICIR